MHYFETGMELSVAKCVLHDLLAWGKQHGGEAMDRGLRQHIDPGIGCGGSPMGGGHRLPLCGYRWRA